MADLSAVGHVHEMLVAGNFAPGNAGISFFMDIICPVLGIGLLMIATRATRGVKGESKMMRGKRQTNVGLKQPSKPA
jgi:hypothetical protein